MKFTALVLLSVALLSLSTTSTVDAFLPRALQKPHGTTFASVFHARKADSHQRTLLRAAEDEDDELDDDEDEEEEDNEDPMARGVDSVGWLPTVIGAKGDGGTLTRKGSELLPLFPLGGIVYTPNSEHILNIFEPRYRQMYSDILMNGTKRFVVSMSHPTKPGSFAEMGVLFELKDLKEVSEQTGDAIKYVCSHKVTGRVKIHRVLNPEAWDTRETYLRIEGTVFDDSGKEGKDEVITSNDVYGAIAKVAQGNPKEEAALRETFVRLVNLQHDLEEDVRFTRASTASLAVKPGPGDDGLWQTIRLWQSFAEQRLMSRQNELQKDFQERLQAFLKKEKGLAEDQLPSVIGFQDLSPELQKEVADLQKRMAVELKPLVIESTLTMQKMLEAEDHTARLKLLKHFMEAEVKRLTTKKALQGMFFGSASVPNDSVIPPEEQIIEDKSQTQSTEPSKPSSIFADEPDAFQ